MIHMSATLPPVEIPAISVHHLSPAAAPAPSRFASLRPHRTALLPKGWQTFVGGSVAALIPLLMVAVVQPHTPDLRDPMDNKAVASITKAAQPDTTLATSPAPAAQADLASTDAGAESDSAYQYALTLAQGYLNKAVDLSRSSQSRQTDEDKQEILALIDTALQHANQAIDRQPRDGTGFLVRARIYMTASVLKPELAALADQDRQIAVALGANAALLDQNPLELLPTQQAQTNNAPIIADPESGDTANTSASTTTNAEHGRVVLPAGESSVWVNAILPESGTMSARSIALTSSAYTVSERNSTGFRIVASQPLDTDTEIEWTFTREEL